MPTLFLSPIRTYYIDVLGYSEGDLSDKSDADLEHDLDDDQFGQYDAWRC